MIDYDDLALSMDRINAICDQHPGSEQEQVFYWFENQGIDKTEFEEFLRRLVANSLQEGINATPYVSTFVDIAMGFQLGWTAREVAEALDA